MTRTVLIEEIDQLLAESRAIMFAMRHGYRKVEVVKAVRVAKAWEVHVKLA